MDEEIKQKIFNTIEKKVNINLLDLDPDKEIREQVSLDSMQFVRIIAIVEDAFGIELPISIMEVTTLNEFFDTIKKELP